MKKEYLYIFSNMEKSAREALIRMLGNYQGYQNDHITIVVFDAYKVDTFYYLAISHIQAWNNTFCQHCMHLPFPTDAHSFR